MAINVPTTSVELVRPAFGLKQPLRSGSLSEIALGFKGVSSEANHAAAHQIQCFGQWGHRSRLGVWFESSTSVVYGPKVSVPIGEHYKQLVLVAEIEDGWITLAHETASQESANQTPKGQVTVTLNLGAHSGAQWYRLGLRANPAGLCILYRATVWEVPLVAADFTW